MRYTKDNPPDFKADFTSREAWEIRAARLRRQVAIALGLTTLPTRPAIGATVHGKTLHDGYTVEKVYFASQPGIYVTGNLYRPAKPKTAKCPVILHPYGHWPEGRFMWMNDEKVDAALANGSESLACSARSPLQACNANFARMGCVVFHYDMIGYCDSTQCTHAVGFDDAQAIMRCQNHMGLQTFNSIRALDFVTALPDVDVDQIAVGGASSGGSQTLMLGIMDDRPKALFIAGMISMNMQGGCPCENAPLLRLDTNNVELCATLAPRHVFASGATGDWTYDTDRRGIPELKHIYELYRAADNVNGNVRDWKHNFNAHTRADFYDFVGRVFGIEQGDAASREREFDPIPPGELSVFDASHERPKDESSIEDLRKQWRPSVSVKELLACTVGEVIPSQLKLEFGGADTITFELKGVARASGTCAISSRAGGPSHEISLDEIEPIKLLKDKPAWFDYVFNRTYLMDRVRQILAIALRVKDLGNGVPLVLISDEASSPAALVACAARPGLFESASLHLNDFDFSQVVDVDDARLVPGILAAGGIAALQAAAAPTKWVVGKR